MLAEVVDTYLTREGFMVDIATDGESGLARALATQPDLVVLDLMLPVLDGLEVCRRLRQAMPTPVIMLTARGEEDDRIVGLELGADDYVTKPFSPASSRHASRPSSGGRPAAWTPPRGRRSKRVRSRSTSWPTRPPATAS